MQDLVTVVVPARNEQTSITGCLASIQAQTYRNLQIIVVDGDSDDETPRVVDRLRKSDPRIELLNNPRRIIPVSLNLATEAARGKWLVRVDAHARVPNDYVSRAVTHLRTGQWGGVGGRKDGIGGGVAGDAIAAAMASRVGVGGSTYHHGTRSRTVEHIPFGAYPLDVIREVGGWAEEMRVNQDFEFDYRVRRSGRQLLFDPDLRIEWENRTDLPALAAQYRRYGRGKVKVIRKHPRSVRPRHLAPPALLVALAATPVLARRRPATATGLVAAYGMVLAGGAIAADRSTPPGVRVRIPAALAVMHLSWGVGFLEGVADWLTGRPEASLLPGSLPDLGARDLGARDLGAVEAHAVAS